MNKCRYCREVKQVFDKNRVPYLNVDVQQLDDAIWDALVALTGRNTVPQVFIDGIHSLLVLGKYVGGNPEVMRMQSNGQLAAYSSQPRRIRN